METDMCKHIMESPNKWLDENICKLLIYQVISALRYLHLNKCGHLDVKCENILISFLKPIPLNNNNNNNNNNKLPPTIKYKNDLPLVKLADFGYSRIIGEHSFRKTRVGTVCRILNSYKIFTNKIDSRKFIVHQKFIVVKKVTID